MYGSLWQSTGEFRWKCAILKPAIPNRQQVRLLTSLILFSSSLKDLSVQRWPFHYLITPSGVYSVKWTWQSRVSAAKRSRSVWSCFTSHALKRITLDHVSPSGPNPVALKQKAVFLSLRRNDAEVWEISTVSTARSIYTEPEPATLTFIHRSQLQPVQQSRNAKRKTWWNRRVSLPQTLYIQTVN